MEGPGLVEKTRQLTDLELAILLSLMADQHCIIETHEDVIDRLGDELELVCFTRNLIYDRYFISQVFFSDSF